MRISDWSSDVCSSDLAGFHIRDDHPMKRWLNVPETLVHSSNIATARIADEMGTGPMQAIFRKLEFDRRPSIELKERDSTLWPSNWGRLTNMTVSYGHGIAVDRKSTRLNSSH